MHTKFLLSLVIVSLVTGSLSPTPVSAKDSVCTNLVINLQKGMRDRKPHRQVALLQDFLRSQKLLSHPATGFYGNLTEQAVKTLQARHAIDPVGSVDAKTRDLIQQMSCSGVSGTVVPVQYLAGTNTNPSGSLPYKTETFDAWKGAWGSVLSTKKGSLHLKATDTTRGAQATFPDSKNWTNYRYTAHVLVSNGDITLISRFKDENNFLACTFSGNWVGIQERVNGKTKLLASAKIQGVAPDQYFLKSTSVAMRVSGNTIGCSAIGIDDDVSFTMDPSHPLTKGGIGIETWGLGAASLELQKVIVEAL